MVYIESSPFSGQRKCWQDGSLAEWKPSFECDRQEFADVSFDSELPGSRDFRDFGGYDLVAGQFSDFGRPVLRPGQIIADLPSNADFRLVFAE
jgi:hypothetical protein